MAESKTTDHEVAEFNRFVKDIRDESDRAAVILAAAKIDLQLYQIIQKFLIPNTSAQDSLLDGDSPLGTFSSRITFAYRSGLIAPDLTRALQLLRRIRNSFAHEFSGISLNAGAHSDRIRELVSAFDRSKAFIYMRNKLYGPETTPAQDFRIAVAIISIRLAGAFDICQPLNASRACELCPPDSDLFTYPAKVEKPEKKV